MSILPLASCLEIWPKAIRSPAGGWCIYTTTLELTLAKIAEADEPAASRLADSAATPHTLFPLPKFLSAGGIQKGKAKVCAGFALQVFGHGGGIQCGRGKAKTIFAGGKGFCFASALLVFGRGVPPRRRVREECAAGIWTGAILYVMIFRTLG